MTILWLSIFKLQLFPTGNHTPSRKLSHYSGKSFLMKWEKNFDEARMTRDCCGLKTERGYALPRESDFKVQAYTLHGVGANFGVGNGYVVGVNGIAFEGCF